MTNKQKIEEFKQFLEDIAYHSKQIGITENSPMWAVKKKEKKDELKYLNASLQDYATKALSLYKEALGGKE